MGLKISLLFFILFSSSSLLKAQDTLSCKKDLTWDKTDRFYYKTGDATKQKYTGPAKCYPQKGVENRGYLKNGNWEGIVYGYKGNIPLGYSNFKDGFYQGPTVRYYEESFDCLNCVKDSFVYNHSELLYSKVFERSKYLDEIKSITEQYIKGDTIRVSNELYDGETPYERKTSTYIKGQKHGLFEYVSIYLDSAKNKEYIPISKSFYQNNKLVNELFYDGGYLYEGKYYDEKGKLLKLVTFYGNADKIESIKFYVNGKTSGDVQHYDENGKLSYTEKYVKGKLIEVIEH